MDEHRPSTLRGIFRHYLKELIYGANDGVITTFAVVAGVTGANLPVRIIISLGIANLVADGFSMAAGNYLSLKSEEDALRFEGRASIEPLPLRHAIATFMAFVGAGAIPLVAYLLPIENPFVLSTLLAGATLVGIGSARTFVNGRPWYREGFEMLLIGAIAALIAYLIGGLIERQLLSHGAT
jgi:vacuolar iron transporter family protein